MRKCQISECKSIILWPSCFKVILKDNTVWTICPQRWKTIQFQRKSQELKHIKAGG